MKRVYTLAAVAALTATAFAATPLQNAPSVADAKINGLQSLECVGEKAPAKAPVRKAVTLADVCGTYTMEYTWALTNNDPYGGKLMVQFEAGSTDNEIIIKNMPWNNVDCIAYVDFTAQTLTINKQDAAVLNDEMNSWLMLGPDTKNPDNKQLVNVDKITANIGNDGNIAFSVDDVLLMGVDGKGYYVGFRGMNFTKLKDYVVDLSKLESAGEAEFTEDALNNLFKDEYRVTTPNKVAAYKNSDNTLVVLKNPYLGGGWNQLNAKSEVPELADGYLVCDITDPEVVLLQTLCPCGLWLDDAEEGMPADYVDFYPYNDEASKVQFEGYTTEDVFMEFDAADKPLSEYYEDTNTIEIRNIWFGQTGSPASKYGFAEEKNPDGTVKVWKPLTMTIVLPENWKEGAGVDSIAAETNNVKRYYNLQGVEIKAPQAGEMVIVKNGNKASKVIF